jgi:hypothetical protein
MLNDIMDAVTRRLNELFGDGYEIYTDAVEQGLKEPCFFVQFLEPSEKPMIGQRYYRQTDMCIQYMAGDIPQLSRELNRAAEILMDGMEYITRSDGSLLRGTGRSVRLDMEGKVLSFFVSFNMFVLKMKPEREPMEGCRPILN